MIKKLFARKLVRRIAWSVAIAITLFVLFHAVENYRGAKAWESTVEMLESNGETADFDKLLPDPVPDAENFGATPALKGITVVIDGDPAKGQPGELRGQIESMGKRLRGEAKTGERPPLSGNPLTSGDAIDLDAWAKFFREHTDLPVPDDAAAPAAEVVLAALEEFGAISGELTAAADRRYARFSPGLEQHRGVEDPFMISLPHLSSMQSLSMLLALRAHAVLELDDSRQAGRTLLAGLRLSELSGDGGMLIGVLVQIAQMNIMLDPLWSALDGRKLDAGALEVLQRRLVASDPIEAIRNGVRLELAGAARALGTAKARGRVADYIQMMVVGEQGGGAGISLLARLAPKGWIDQNRASLARMHWEYQLQPLMSGGPRLAKQKMEEMLAWEQQGRTWPGPYTFLARLTMPSMAKVFQRAAQARAYRDLQICAIALERYYLERQEYPETLNALVPKFLDHVPGDIMADSPLNYQRTDDARYRIYSVGWDGVDGGGVISTDEEDKVDRLSGDWVWHYDRSAIAVE